MDEYHIYQPPQYKGIREDLVLVTHVSYMMSLETVKKVHQYLNDNNIANNIFNEKTQHYRPLAVTLAYSHAPIRGVTPWYDKESFTEILPLDSDIVIRAPVDMQLGCFIDPDGVVFDVMVIRDPVFEEHKKAFDKAGAVWHLGEFLPFIKINDKTTLDSLGSPTNAFPEFTEDLVFDRMRYMLFGESKTL